MVDMFSGKDAYSYACLKSLPIVAGEDAGACSSVEDQKTLLRRIRDAVSVRMEQGWKSTLRDDASMLGHMQASDASDARLMAALKYRIQSKKRDRSQRLSSQLSKWLRDDVVSYPTYGGATSSLAQFFKARAAIPLKESTSIPGQQQPRTSFAVTHRSDSGTALPRVRLDTVPSAMDSIGIADLVGPVAKMDQIQTAH